MREGVAQSSSKLKEGPLFSDEIGWADAVSDAVRRRFDLESIYINPPKNAREGIYTIYFTPQHREWALVRYAQRYRWLFEILLNRGIAGEQFLHKQGLTEDDIQFLLDIVPAPPVDHNPTVYDILWNGSSATEYLEVADILNQKLVDGVETVIPRELITQESTLSEDHLNYFGEFVRRHLLQTVDEDLASANEAGKRSTDSISIDPTVEYEVTAEGRSAVSAIVSEAERILAAQSFDPLLINPDADPEAHLRDLQDQQSSGSSEAGDKTESGQSSENGDTTSTTHETGQTDTKNDAKPPDDNTMNTQPNSAPSSEESANEIGSKNRTLFDLLRSCQMGEAGAIVGGHIDRNELRQDLYIPTEEDETLTDFFVDEYQRDGRFLVITGSAGDGKSALLSHAFKKALEADNPVKEEHIHMDATAASRKHETYDETLKRFLDEVSKYLEKDHGPRTGLAINLGLAINFFDRQKMGEEFPEIWDAIDDARTQREVITESVHVINLGHRNLYSTRPDELGDGLLRDIVEKFAFDDPSSPFHEAYNRERNHCPAGDRCPLHYNATQFTKKQVRERVARLIAANGLVNNKYLNPRSALDHISSMILPAELQHVDDHNICPVGAAINRDDSDFDPSILLWNTVFEQLGGSDRDETSHIDPAAQSSVSLDQQLLSWSANPDELEELAGTAPYVSTADSATQVRTILRRLYLLGEKEIETALEQDGFKEFLGALTYLNQRPVTVEQGSELQQHVSALLENVTKSLQGWSGSIDDSDHIEFVDGIKSTEYRFLSKWSPPDPHIEESHRQTREETTPGQLWLVLQPEGTDVTVPVPVTFGLYRLMKRIRNGYNPNALDLEQSEGMRLIHSRLSEFTNKQELVRVVDKLGDEMFRVERGGFNTINIKAGDDL